MEQNNKCTNWNEIEKLSTETLDDMLIKELSSKTVDADLVRMILDILWERERTEYKKISPEAKERCRQLMREYGLIKA